MKNLSLPFALVSCVLIALVTPGWTSITGDGRGIFSVIVEVQERDSGTFVEGAKVFLSDAGADEVEKDQELKRYAQLFAPSATNLAGHTLVYYYGGFAFESVKGQTQGVRGKLTITKAGYEDVTIGLSEIIGQSVKTDEKCLPRITITLKKR